MPTTPKVAWLGLLKLIISLILLWALLRRVPLDTLARSLDGARPWLLVAACLLLALRFPIWGLKWGVVLRRIGYARSPWSLQSLVWIGQALNQIAPIFIAGDAVRGIHLVRAGVPKGVAASSLFWDRMLGALGGALLIVLTVPVDLWLLGATATTWSIAVLGLGTLVAIPVLILGHRLPARFAERSRLMSWLTRLLLDGRAQLSDPATATSVLGLAVAINLVMTLGAYLLALGLGIPVTPLLCLVAVPAGLLIAQLPFSIAGWGVREGAFALLLGLFGVSTADAVLLSIALGLATAISAAPGALIWMTLRE